MPASAAFCPGCGRRMIIVPAAVAATGFLKENVAAALAYVTFIPAIVFLWVRPFNHNRLVRFHSWQSIFLAVAVVVAGIGLRMLFSILSLIPRFGYLLASLAVLVVALGFVILWLVVVVKAFQGELFKLPVIGGVAERA
ncbi:MAG TPA: hypothetical protein VEG68_12695 [Terriglobales bacterium]|nr:hypothetical protein [Terriglobales bacterium]